MFACAALLALPLFFVVIIILSVHFHVHRSPLPLDAVLLLVAMAIGGIWVLCETVLEYLIVTQEGLVYFSILSRWTINWQSVEKVEFVRLGKKLFQLKLHGPKVRTLTLSNLRKRDQVAIEAAICAHVPKELQLEKQIG